MYQEFYAQSEHLIWPLIGLLIFLAGFVAVLIYVIVGLRDRDTRSRLARLPLESDGSDQSSSSDSAIAEPEVS